MTTLNSISTADSQYKVLATGASRGWDFVANTPNTMPVRGASPIAPALRDISSFSVAQRPIESPRLAIEFRTMSVAIREQATKWCHSGLVPRDQQTHSTLIVQVPWQ
ncbi:hypothetical protein G7Z17_g10180 [Cylindrodendrum hubeiense]|uniref:Uncharacterized protein n=1 Tax=Cylindrodendrum hubeiense TaxID=595255 RepID=A0A9P5H5A7_9HYPO|nr:hypothetical protein G7Z17_g10180 [Cylindrodendrum hubeiense]